MAQSEQINKWLSDISLALPMLFETLKTQKSESVIIGATLLELYPFFGLPIKATRVTGDLDLSINANVSTTTYKNIRKALLKFGYTIEEPDKIFRLYSPTKVPGLPAYVDLLAHTNNPANYALIRKEMGVGPDWNFASIEFCTYKHYQVNPDIAVPNIFGFLFMKFTSWESDPYRRVRDLVDTADVVKSLVQASMHYDLATSWKDLKNVFPVQCKELNLYLQKCANPDEITINFEDHFREFASRGYRYSELEKELPRLYEEFLNAL